MSDRVERLRRLAEEARTEAKATTNEDAKRALEEIAAAYEELAEDAERLDVLSKVEDGIKNETG
jgi:hypothetical protein